MFKVYQNISPPIFSEIFHRRDISYNLRINLEFAMSNLRSVFHGSESISHLGTFVLEAKKLFMQVM